jgi:EAL domain-containing protein (putative c-di-GMP-specific phosphodiesterase class I)/GGDEF domain-containing protein
MSTAVCNALALVELANVDGLLDTHGSESFKTLQEVFVERLKRWARVTDKWKLLDNNRFCVLLHGIESRAEIELAAAKLERLFDEPCHFNDDIVLLDIKAGFARINAAQGDIKVAIRQAGVALQNARTDPRIFQIYNPRSKRHVTDERELVSRLEAALELGELVLYFQPKIHAAFRNVVGAEALVRWHTRTEGILQPNDFMPVAERHSVIKPLSWWVIKAAVARLARWPSNLSIAVNVPPTLLMDGEILSLVRDALDIYSVDAGRLTLEVTESIMVENQEIMLRQLARLRELGVRISIDDFGTGFSSLAYFRDLPADEIKIDKGFVMPMLKSGKDHAIVKAVVDLAHNFSLRVVAEGVENERTARRLTDLGCDVLQGFAFDEPLPIEIFEERYLV